MVRLRNKQSGFTLIELLVVVVIVAVLAVVGIPLMQGNVARARLTEADAALGTIRTAMRAEQAENGALPSLSAVAATAAGIGINAGDLTGRFFEDDDFTITSTPGDATATPPVLPSYCVSVDGDTAGAAPRGNQVDDVVRSLDEEGNIYESDDCTGTVIN